MGRFHHSNVAENSSPILNRWYIPGAKAPRLRLLIATSADRNCAAHNQHDRDVVNRRVMSPACWTAFATWQSSSPDSQPGRSRRETVNVASVPTRRGISSGRPEDEDWRATTFHSWLWLLQHRAQTDYAGVLEQTCSSLPFGDGLSCTGSTQYPTEHHFTGKERDIESGNDYFKGSLLEQLDGQVHFLGLEQPSAGCAVFRSQ